MQPQSEPSPEEQFFRIPLATVYAQGSANLLPEGWPDSADNIVVMLTIGDQRTADAEQFSLCRGNQCEPGIVLPAGRYRQDGVPEDCLECERRPRNDAMFQQDSKPLSLCQMILFRTREVHPFPRCASGSDSRRHPASEMRHASGAPKARANSSSLSECQMSS